MQTFLPYADFGATARVLDRRRLGKQRVEALQVLRGLTVPGYGWRHHPAVRMWTGYEEALVRYGLEMCRPISLTCGRSPIAGLQRPDLGVRDSGTRVGDPVADDSGGTVRVRWRQRLRAARWPAGVSLAVWRWVRLTRRVRRQRLDAGVDAEIARTPERGGERLQDPRKGVGAAFHRRYSVRISGSTLTAEELIQRLCDDLNVASPVEFAVFDKTSGTSLPLATGDEYDVHMPGPWNCPVRVVERTAVSFRFVTLRGHMEAGEIEFRATDTPEGDLVFAIESWARSGDRLAEAVYDRLRIGKEMQLHMWTHFCVRTVELSGGRISGEVEVRTERAAVPGLVTRTAAKALTTLFVLVARLRGGRPLHPRGLVLDATLRLGGTSRSWGVPLLDERVTLRGQARLSRGLGLPVPLPDVLGLALRWGQATGPAELLLATTGHGLVGRHLLRPATRWSPGFYGSLLAYEAGDRHVLLGAVARERDVPADPDVLARAVGRRPIALDLVVATGTGAWERFGELVLTGPARSDDSEPMRFEPARHPIADLPPAGPFQRMREPVYAAVHSFARRGRGA